MAGETRMASASGAEWVELVGDASTLAARRAQWDDLAAHATEANPFYEPWVLLPAVRAFRPDFRDLAFALVYRGAPPLPLSSPDAPAARAANGSELPQLIGLFPFERRRHYRGVPCRHLALWDYGPCYLGTPLVRRGYETRALEALWQWLEAGRGGGRAVELTWVPAEGPVAHALTDFYRVHVALSLQSRPFTRAVLIPRETGEQYLRLALNGDRRRELARRRRRLEELGNLTYDECEHADALDGWIEEYLALEASGWKGRRGTALLSRPAEAAFFRAAARDGFARGRIWLTALRLDGRAIAMRCSFLAPPAAFFFKPAYDERLRRYAPGVLLELENIRRVHERPDLHWMDSCTSPGNEVLNTLWLDRRMLQNLTWADYRGVGGLALTAQMLFRWTRCLGKRSNTNPVYE